MANPEGDRWGLVIVWEFEVRPGMEARFEQVYGEEGDWAQFFRRGSGYLGTQLSRSHENLHYLTLDFWTSRAAYEDFRRQHAAEYQAIDQKCEALTEKEREIGKFERVP